MSDFISREGAIHAILDTESKVARETPYDSKVFGVMAKRQNEILDVLLTLPSAEPKTGRWIFNTGEHTLKSFFICSECGGSIFHESNYCPNCGAKMEGGEEE